MERCRFIHAEEANFKIVTMCRVLRVSRSGYYAWRRDRAHASTSRHDAFDAKVEAAHRASRERYGSRRVQRELNEAGVPCSRNRVVYAMRRRRLKARGRRRFKATTDSNHAFEVEPNLLVNERFQIGHSTFEPRHRGASTVVSDC